MFHVVHVIIAVGTWFIKRVLHSWGNILKAGVAFSISIWKDLYKWGKKCTFIMHVFLYAMSYCHIKYLHKYNICLWKIICLREHCPLHRLSIQRFWNIIWMNYYSGVWTHSDWSSAARCVQLFHWVALTGSNINAFYICSHFINQLTKKQFYHFS